MVLSPIEFSVAMIGGVLRQSDSEPPSDANDGDVVSDVGNEIKVTLDQWTAGQLGIADLVAASVGITTGGMFFAREPASLERPARQSADWPRLDRVRIRLIDLRR